jgi:hypothetical protein
MLNYRKLLRVCRTASFQTIYLIVVFSQWQGLFQALEL